MTTQLDAIEDIHFPPFHKTVAFDIIFGIVGPILCLLFDPVVFRTTIVGGMGGPVLGGVMILAYVSFIIQFTALAIWLTYRRPSSFLSGILWGGACLSAIIGIALIPISLLGTLFMGIGLLGFTPFVTAIVYRRNAIAAWPDDSSETEKPKQTGLAFFGAALACAIPVFAQIVVGGKLEQATQLVLSDNAEEADRAVAVIKRYRLLANLDSLVHAYGSESNDKKRERLAAVYQEIVGDDIQVRWQILDD